MQLTFSSIQELQEFVRDVLPTLPKEPVKETVWVNPYKDALHFSNTKRQYVKISEMNFVHLKNALRLLMEDMPQWDAVDHEEFRAIVVTLAGQILDLESPEPEKSVDEIKVSIFSPEGAKILAKRRFGIGRIP